MARAPARDVIAALAPDRIVGALETGTMRVQGESLTPEQRRAIAAYLSTARPAPAARSAAGWRTALRRRERAAHVGERLARVGRDAGQRSLSARSRDSPPRRRRT